MNAPVQSMRFVRNVSVPAWGLGVIASEEGCNLDVLFESAGHKKMQKTSAMLTDVPEAEVPSGHPLRTRAEWPKLAAGVARAKARLDLPRQFETFVQEFLARFPGGLRSEECEATERAYKWKAVEYARETLKLEKLEGLLQQGDHGEVIRLTRRTLGKTNLAFPNELMKFDDLPVSAHAHVAERIVGLVTAGESTPEALEAFAEALRPHGAHKWTLCSLLPFLLAPERWPFVKPTAIERTVEATKIDVEYDAMPNARTYRLICELYDQVFTLLTERDLEPRDAIDVQTFLWVASGMARETRDAKTRKAAKKVGT